jgi:hypothetical protein
VADAGYEQAVMAWALALVVAVGVGLPVAAWFIARRPPPPSPARGAARGYDAVDRWLADRYQLAWRERSRVRTAVFRGYQMEEPRLAPAAHGLAAQVLADGFWVLRWSRMLGWADLGLGIGLGATGVVWLSTRGHPEGLLPVLGVVNAGLLCAGARRAWREPRQIRRNAAQALRVNRDAD